MIDNETANHKSSNEVDEKSKITKILNSEENSKRN